MFIWGLQLEGEWFVEGLDYRFVEQGLCPLIFFELEGVSIFVTLGAGCIPARGQLVAGIGNIISAPASAGRSTWHKYL